MQEQFQAFVIRWLLNSLGLWVAVRLVGTGYEDTPESTMVFLFAGLIFSIANAMFKPMLIILSLPILLVTLGLFMVVVNGLLVYVSLRLAPGVDMTFGHAIATGIIISFVNYLMTNVLNLHYLQRKESTK
ncbi:hypothetical protein CR983_03820 [Candidatus Saccharibacteria bacterium]|nr:MAG: hypothetical protein CR983_03820 [Candidatus Saccharibacteria bacterium]